MKAMSIVIDRSECGQIAKYALVELVVACEIKQGGSSGCPVCGGGQRRGWREVLYLQLEVRMMSPKR